MIKYEDLFLKMGVAQENIDKDDWGKAAFKIAEDKIVIVDVRAIENITKWSRVIVVTPGGGVIEDPNSIRVLRESDEVRVLTDKEIRDTDTYYSKMINMKLFTYCTFFIKNDLDQDVTVQVKGNRFNSRTGAVNMGSSFTVSAGSSESRTITPDTSGWLPYLYVEINASSSPSSGRINVYAIRRG